MNKAERRVTEKKLLALEEICRQQRDSLAAQQETIVRLNDENKRTIGVLVETYGTDNQLRFPIERYEKILEDYADVHVKVDGENFLAYLAMKEE